MASGRPLPLSSLTLSSLRRGLATRMAETPPFPPPLSAPGPPVPLVPGLVTHTGACHCGRVAFEADAPARLPAVACNCSRCSLIAGPFAIIPASRFRLTKGEPGSLTTYQFGTRAAVHTFCTACGVQAFYRPRSNPACVSVLVPALARGTLASVDVSRFDGIHWERAFAEGGAPKPAE